MKSINENHGPDPAKAEPAGTPIDTATAKKLKHLTLRGVSYSLISQVSLTLIKLASTAILARILEPKEFGLIAMATLAIGILEMFREGGLSMVAIQRQDLTAADQSSLFWINTALTLVTALVVALIAPALSWFFDEPKLIEITCALALVTLIGGIGIQHKAILRRNLSFGKLTCIDIVSSILGSVAAIIMARLGFSYWALVMMYGVTGLLSTILSIVLGGWLPDRPAVSKKTSEFIRFGANLTGAKLFSTLAARVDNLLIAHFCGPTELALYDRAYQLMMMPLRQFDNVIGSAVLPALCRIQDDRKRLRSFVIKSQGITYALTIPATTTLIVFSDTIIDLVLGDKWTGAGPIFRTLAAVTIFMSICRPVNLILRALGEVDTILKFEFVGSLLAIAAFAIGVYWGPLGVARALLVENFLWSIVLLQKLVTLLGLTRKDLTTLAFQPIGLSALFVTAGLAFRHFHGSIASPLSGILLMAGFFALGTLMSFVVNPAIVGWLREFLPSLLLRKAKPE